MEEYKKEMLMVSAILFKNNVPVEEAKPIGAFIEKLIEENQQLQQLKDQLELSERARKEAIECINKELEEIGKHQYAIGTRRLNKIKNILDIDKQIDKYVERINNDPKYDDLEPIEFREHMNHVKEQMMTSNYHDHNTIKFKNEKDI